MASSTDSVPRFQCILTNDPEKASSNPLWFEQEEGKKSSFLLQLDDAAGEILKPAHVFLQGGDSFIFGALEFVSNARNVEIYLTEDGKETYLTTSRGLIVSGDDPYRFKCIVLCPGGPRAVTRVHLKLLSLKPASCTHATLHLMKLRGRLPPPKQAEDASTAAVISSRSAETDNNKAPPGLTKADMGVAMTGVSMLVRSVESSLLESVQGALDKVEKRLGARLDRIEQYLVMQQQAAIMQQQHQQQRFEDMQNQMMLQMKEHQSEMASLISSLRAHVFQPNEQEEANGAESRGVNEVKSEERHSEPRPDPTQIPDADELEGSSEEDASMPPDGESKEAEHTAESSTMEPVASNGNLNAGNDVGEAENEKHAVAEASTDDLEQGDVTISTDVRSLRGMNPIERQAEPVVLANACTKTEDRDREQSEVSLQVIREACSTLELKMTEEELTATEPVEPLDERLGGNDQEEDAIAEAGANESNPEEEESIPPPKRRPVMEKRDDVMEIPDLLADLSNNEPPQEDNSSETNQAADDSLNSLNNS